MVIATTALRTTATAMAVGITDMGINTAVNVREAYLKVVSTGATLQFTLTDSQHDSLQFETNTAYITSVYDAWKWYFQLYCTEYRCR